MTSQVVLSRKAGNLSSRHKRTVNNDITFLHRQRGTQIKTLQDIDIDFISRTVHKDVKIKKRDAMCEHRFGNFLRKDWLIFSPLYTHRRLYCL